MAEAKDKSEDKKNDSDKAVEEAQTVKPEITKTIIILRLQLLTIVQMLHVYTFSALPLSVSYAIAMLSPFALKLFSWLSKSSSSEWYLHFLYSAVHNYLPKSSSSECYLYLLYNAVHNYLPKCNKY